MQGAPKVFGPRGIRRGEHGQHSFDWMRASAAFFLTGLLFARHARLISVCVDSTFGSHGWDGALSSSVRGGRSQMCGYSCVVSVCASFFSGDPSSILPSFPHPPVRLFAQKQPINKNARTSFDRIPSSDVVVASLAFISFFLLGPYCCTSFFFSFPASCPFALPAEPRLDFQSILKIGPFAAVSCSNDRTLRTWDHRVKGSVGVLRGHTGPVTCVQVSPPISWSAVAVFLSKSIVSKHRHFFFCVFSFFVCVSS